jgi:hypothetical protein
MTTLRRSERLKNKPKTTDELFTESKNQKKNNNIRYNEKKPLNNQFNDYDKFSMNKSFKETIQFQEFCANNEISYFTENKMEIEGFLETIALFFSQFLAMLVMVIPIVVNKFLDSKVYHDLVYYYCHRNCTYQHWAVQFHKNSDKDKMKQLSESMNGNGKYLRELYLKVKKKNDEIYQESVKTYMKEY